MIDYFLREKGIYIKYGQEIAEGDYYVPKAYS